MKKLTLSIILALACGSAMAMTHFLVAQWFENGNQMCRYDNGTVLNVGVNLCPLTIGR